MIEVVCGVMRDSGGRYLACKRPAGKHLASLWEFPGGKIEVGETAEEALIRELREELGIEVEVGEKLTSVAWMEILLIPFVCRIISGNLRPIEHSELRWCHAENFSTLSWAPADVPICNELLMERKFWAGDGSIWPETPC